MKESSVSGVYKENVAYSTSFLSDKHIAEVIDDAIEKGLLDDVYYPPEAKVPLVAFLILPPIVLASVVLI